MMTGFDLSDKERGPGIDLDEIIPYRRRILVVEDEPDTVYLLKHILRMAGYNVVSALNGTEALQKAEDYNPDLVLLDLMMPDMDGWETLDSLRKVGDTPVIILTALVKNADVVQGLRMGADDYLTKPFHNDEVVARVEAVLRRSGHSKNLGRLIFPKIDLAVELKTQMVLVQNRFIELTPREFAVLAELAQRAPRAVDYVTISEAIWGESDSNTRNRIKYLVYLLRQKLEQAGLPVGTIVNLGRVGYRLVTEP